MVSVQGVGGPPGATWGLTGGWEAGARGQESEVEHSESRAGRMGVRADSSFGYILRFHPKCHFLPEAFSEDPMRTGWGGFQGLGTPAKW